MTDDTDERGEEYVARQRGGDHLPERGVPMNHDPMLDGLTRWAHATNANGGYTGMAHYEDGGWVKFSDLPALIARVREDERNQCIADAADVIGEQAHGHYMDGYKVGYARGLIEGDHGGRREGYRSGYAAGKDVVMTASYAQAVAEGQRDEREACAQTVLADGLHSVYPTITEMLADAIRARGEKP